ncbi:MAG: protein kinase [Deltaproteobacteria bacterium]
MIRRLGEGAMGVVYLARDRERGQDVALKTLRQIDAPTLLHFKREFRALAGISHPNLVSLFELFHAGDQWFFTMELAEGVSFQRWVRPDGVTTPSETGAPTVRFDQTEIDEPTIDQAVETMLDDQLVNPISAPPLDEDRLWSALRQLVAGVHALHRAGRLHRDLKPSNVRVLPSGRVVIMDFGLVTELEAGEEHASTSDRVVGTAGYMSPEQAAGRTVTPASDWYAVGCMLFEALTGRRPFVGAVMDVLLEKSQRDGPHPRFVNASVPEALDELTAQLLKLDPKGRPRGPELLERLDISGRQPLHYREGASAVALRPLVGREPELARLRGAFLQTDQRRLASVWVRGPSGVGKSALVAHFCETLRGIGNAVILRGACHEHEAVRYRAFDAVIDALARFLEPLHPDDVVSLMPRHIEALVRVFPVLRIVPPIEAKVRDQLAGVPTRDEEPQQVRLRAFRALRELLDKLARRVPVVVWIDDLQWGDVDSAPMFEELTSPPDPPHIMLIGSYRSEADQRGPLVELLEDELGASATKIDLVPLAEDEAEGLAASLLDGAPGDVRTLARRIARESDGSPYFIVELLRHVQDEGGAAAVRAAVDEGLSLDEVIRERIEALPAVGRRALNAVAIAVRPVSFGVLGAVIEEDTTALVWRLLTAGSFVRAGVGASGDERIAPYHPRIRQVVERDLHEREVERFHLRLARAFEEHQPDDVEAIAFHYARADEPEHAVRFAERAARLASEGLAFDRAAELFAVAQELDPEPTTSLRRRRADALANAGRGLEAAEVFLALARESSGADALQLRRRAAEQLLRTGHIDRGLECIANVLDDIGLSLSQTPRGALASLVRSRMAVRLRGLRFKRTPAERIPADKLARVDILWSVATGLGMVDSTLGLDFQSRHLVEALEVGEPYRAARALAMEACYSATGGVGSRRRTARVVEIADSLARTVDDPHALGLVEMAKGTAAFLEGRFAEGRAASTRAESILRERCRGVWWEIATSQVFNILSMAFLGELGALERFVRANVREAQARGDRYATANFKSGAANLAYLVRDDIAGGAAALQETRDHLPKDGFTIPHFYELVARINLLLYAGRAEEAFAAVDAVRREASRSMVLRIQYLRIDVLFAFARAALAASDGAAAKAHLDLASDWAARLEREPARWSAPLAYLVRAGVAARRGDARAARDAYGRAAKSAAEQQMGHIEVCARWAQQQDASALEPFDRQRVARPEQLARVFVPS